MIVRWLYHKIFQIAAQKTNLYEVIKSYESHFSETKINYISMIVNHATLLKEEHPH